MVSAESVNRADDPFRKRTWLAVAFVVVRLAIRMVC